MSGKKQIFSARICEGYPMRIATEIFKKLTTETTITFNKDGFSIYENNGDDLSNERSEVMLSMHISEDDIEDYHYNYTDVNGILKDKFAIGIVMREFVEQTSQVGKKDGIKMWMLEGDSNLYIHAITNSSENGRDNLGFIKTKPVTPKFWKPFVYNSKNKPNAKISSAEFAKICAALKSVKCDYISVLGFKDGIILHGKDSSHTIKKVERLGPCSQKLEDCDVKLDTNIHNILLNTNKRKVDKPKPLQLQIVDDIKRVGLDIKIDTIKNLSKLNNISGGGIVKLYIGKDLPLTIQTNVGHYGIFCAHLHNYSI
jgi:hypothetical protein